ncbi:hypothetical protein Pla22_16250 [Rubripirellula amarantea]|uniref:HEAT repeat protein n=1 Tax=Rubripirellula amarantea TaxID=2527999 RepID=A0A5C5WV62_9BACT|nr:hypothetical protein [Rubripirellula amarantea]TWT53991.1 hypothetical protein Pla22_16250 [Rubripirellula amarantea]
MVTKRCMLAYLFSLTLSMCVGTSVSNALDPSQAIEVIVNVGARGEGFDEARIAANELRSLPSSEVIAVLEAMSEASPVGRNWLRGIANDIVRKSGPVSVEVLATYVRDTSNDPDGRDFAITLIEDQSPQLALQLIRQGLNDPSLLIRERAVAEAMKQTKGLVDQEPEQAIERYRQTLAAARNPKQVSELLKALTDLGQDVTTAEAFSMISSWQVIGPFDNRDGVGFDRAYEPEADFTDDAKIDFEQVLDGKNGDVKWETLSATNDEGELNLAEHYEKEKGAVAYAYTEFTSTSNQPAQIRLGCVNANKVWLNGEQVMANKVYHSGSMIDQYIANVELKSGSNRILVKVCQNEQTQPWAQDWKFQCRITDLTGKGLTSH